MPTHNFETPSPVASGRGDIHTTIIAAGQTESEVLDLDNQRLLAVRVPTGWTAATISFKGTIEGGELYPLYIDNTEISITVAPDRYVLVDPAHFFGFEQIILVSSVAQIGAREIEVLTVSA